jgi:hypothetical protein
MTTVSRTTIYLHRKKRLATFPSPAAMSLTKLFRGGNNPRESLVSDIPAGGDGNVANFFYTVVMAQDT